MGHFCGYLLRDQSSSAGLITIRDKMRRRVVSAVDRSRPGLVDETTIGPIWVVRAAETEWPESICAEETADSIGIVAGAPIWSNRPPHGRNESRLDSKLVIAALLGDRGRELSDTAGSFAAMTWCARTQVLHLATDKLATRCLYYKIESSKISFSTSLRLLRIINEDPETASEAGIAETLFLGQPLSNRTVFDGVFVVLPGELISFTRSSAVERKRYFDYRQISPMEVSKAEASQSLHEVFSRAVRRRIQLSGAPHEAFLSGGMDSRAVVAELVDQGHRVSTFCTAYPGSIDDLVSTQVARHLGCDHQIWHRSPAERVRTALDPFAMYAREHFKSSRDDLVRHIWSGDGGSVMMGHVYLTRQRAFMAQNTLDKDLLLQLFPTLRSRPTKQIPGNRIDRLRELALEGLNQEFIGLSNARPEKRLFLYYALNDQTRHLYHHFESIDVSRVELVTPFFDADFVSMVMALPTDWFIDHALYNEWITGFRCGAASIYWQPYRGHIPGPHAAPSQIADQWDSSWYASSAVRKAQVRLVNELLAEPASLADDYIDRKMLSAVGFFNRIGVTRFNYEISHARNMIAAFS